VEADKRFLEQPNPCGAHCSTREGVGYRELPTPRYPYASTPSFAESDPENDDTFSSCLILADLAPSSQGISSPAVRFLQDFKTPGRDGGWPRRCTPPAWEDRPLENSLEWMVARPARTPPPRLHEEAASIIRLLADRATGYTRAGVPGDCGKASRRSGLQRDDSIIRRALAACRLFFPPRQCAVRHRGRGAADAKLDCTEERGKSDAVPWTWPTSCPLARRRRAAPAHEDDLVRFLSAELPGWACESECDHCWLTIGAKLARHLMGVFSASASSGPTGAMRCSLKMTRGAANRRATTKLRLWQA